VKTYVVDAQLGQIVPIERKFRYWMPEPVTKPEYTSAYEAFLRKRHFEDIGPNDRKTLSEGMDSAGGYLVPPDLHMELIRKMATMATVRPNARVVTTSRDMAQWPKILYDTDDEYTSGVR